MLLVVLVDDVDEENVDVSRSSRFCSMYFNIYSTCVS